MKTISDHKMLAIITKNCALSQSRVINKYSPNLTITLFITIDFGINI